MLIIRHWIISHRSAKSRLKYDLLITVETFLTAAGRDVYVFQALIMVLLINAAVQIHPRTQTHAHWNETLAPRRFCGSDVTDVVAVLDCLQRDQSLGEIPLTDGLKLMNQANKPAASVLLHNVLWEGRTWWGASRSAGSDELPPACWWWTIRMGSCFRDEMEIRLSGLQKRTNPPGGGSCLSFSVGWL